MSRRRVRWALLAVALVLCACGRVPNTRYFTISMPAPAPAADSKTPFVLDVPRFQAAEALRDDRILYFRSPTELNYYQYHRWSAQPATLVAELVATDYAPPGPLRKCDCFLAKGPATRSCAGG